MVRINESFVEKIVTGGQTGVDRAALDVALSLSFPCGGWCPKGRRAEDGIIAGHYPLKETDSSEYEVRTDWNARDSDATLILCFGALEGGTKYTEERAQAHGKPCLVVDLLQKVDYPAILAWLARHKVRCLNIAGPRESLIPGTVYRESRIALERVFSGRS